VSTIIACGHRERGKGEGGGEEKWTKEDYSASYKASKKQLSRIPHLRCKAQTFPLFDGTISGHELPRWVAKKPWGMEGGLC